MKIDTTAKIHLAVVALVVGVFLLICEGLAAALFRLIYPGQSYVQYVLTGLQTWDRSDYDSVLWMLSAPGLLTVVGLLCYPYGRKAAGARGVEDK